MVGLKAQGLDWDGRSHICGGRVEVRCALYMAALAAVRGDSPASLLSASARTGKEKKVALTACIRKLPSYSMRWSKTHSVEALMSISRLTTKHRKHCAVANPAGWKAACAHALRPRR